MSDFSFPPHGGQTQSMRVRTRWLALLFATVCFGGLLARLYHLQLTTGSWYAQKAAGQQLQDTIVPADRGEILSADGRVLAASATCWTIRVRPCDMAQEDVAPAAAALAAILELDEGDVLEKLSDRSSTDALLRYRVGAEMADAVRAWLRENEVEGVLIMQDTKRWYPEGDFAASVLGFTNVDNAGLAGLELEYNTLLSGTAGRVLTAKNAWGDELPQNYATYIAPVQGATLTLTLDATIQHYLENQLIAAVQEHGVRGRAFGIVMEVKTGAVLAIATKPDFDPNEPRVIADEGVRAAVDALEGEERDAARQLAQQTQWRNKAISDLYEPGSVFKLITASAALDSHAVSLSDHFSCGSSIGVSGTRFHCANNRQHGSQNIARALQNSCNQAFVQIGARVGREKFCDYFAAFGLREATGIDLPAEPVKSEYYTADRMGPVELASCSFGQSSKITPIGMITAISAIVNGGKLMQPYLVASAVDADGNQVYEARPTVKRQVISPETSATMCQLMAQVVTLGGGKNCYLAGYRVGGKSGTSQKLDAEQQNSRIASFVGVAPMDDPQIAVLIALDDPHSFTTTGGALAAPAVAKVMESALEYRGVERVYTEEEQAKRERILPDLTGNGPQYACTLLEDAGLRGAVRGDGDKVQAQSPAAGSPLPKGSTVFLYTSQQALTAQVVVPSVYGQTPEQAAETLAAAGLNLSADGAAALGDATARHQSFLPGDTLSEGSIVTVDFYDEAVQDDEPEG